ncbi:hydrogenase/urease maturation nickel metallochaperone HypA, partial [Escherichia coli]|uniref:hydrogenase/urease maturation nickel metallochaperone HypA n=1 Tax=Escherichia coli TaxID=562 RepID=UPI0020754DE4
AGNLLTPGWGVRFDFSVIFRAVFIFQPEEQEAECWCETCQQYVTLLTQRVRRCPQCHGDMLQIVADDGLQIRRIEIDQE